jgi:hypothetical protein
MPAAPPPIQKAIYTSAKPIKFWLPLHVFNREIASKIKVVARRQFKRCAPNCIILKLRSFTE